MKSSKLSKLKMREARFWPKMKFETIFFQVLWQFFNPEGSLLRAGGRGFGGNSEQAALRADHIFASEPDFDFWRGTIYEVITFF